MLSIRTNIASFDAQRNLSGVSGQLTKSMEKLSSGFRINRAGDDAAGLAISEKLKAQVGGLMQAARNSGDGISMIQTAEGGLDEVQNMMQRIRELAVQAANDTVGTAERADINSEIQQLRTELQNIGERTKFNGQGLLNGQLVTKIDATSVVVAGAALTTSAATLGSVKVDSARSGQTFTLSFAAGVLTATDSNTPANTQSITLNDVAQNTSQTFSFSKFGVSLTVVAGATDATAATFGADLAGLATLVTANAASGSTSAVLQTGANAGDETTVSFADVRVEDSASLAGLKVALDAFNGVSSQANASALISSIDAALDSVSSTRAVLGAVQNRLEHTIANVKTSAENLSASDSRIRDVDVAEESAIMARSQVLMQAGVSVLAQANQIPQLALKLLG
jgi:flagellin